jgi:phytoene dehydrogenase-like protein
MSELDAVVVGGGVAGLFAALRLARAGVKTALFEQNHQLGGLAAGIRRKGFYFDVGCQSVIDAGILFPLLERMGASDGRWRRARFRVVAERGGYDFVADGLDSVRDALSAGDPGAAQALGSVFRQHHRAACAIEALRRCGLPHVRTDEGRVLDLLRRLPELGRPLWSLRAGFKERYEDFYARTLPPGPARDLLTALGYPGMSAFFAGAVWHCWSHDYWYPNGGLQAWLDDLGSRFTAAGGTVRFKSRIRRLLREERRCTGIELADGTSISARAIVLAVDLMQVLGELLPPELLDAKRRRQLAAARATALTTPLLACYVGLSWPPEELRRRLGAAHLFHLPAGASSLPAPEADGHRRCWIQVAGHSAFETGEARSSVVVQCFTDPSWQNRYGIGDRPALPRPPAYQELTERLRGDLVALLDQAMPGAAAAVVYADVGTPLSTERFTRSPLGSSAGFSWYLPEVPWSVLGWRRGIPGLYTCGQTTIWPGSIALSGLSGKIAADLAIRDLGRSS